ncbi:MAG: hypothetical protein AVO39_07660 [delta proteobacterium MLS_D]|jgi:hypothetical protein|nr:MAG: hypothetical protein AVO39_07660 [delta proteobacterium MLS_D]
MYTIGLRYCGGCNPQIDRTRVVKDFREGIAKLETAVDITTDRSRAVDLLLLINGCEHACLEEDYSERDGPIISVEGLMVDRRPVEEDRISETLVEKIVRMISSSAH